MTNAILWPDSIMSIGNYYWVVTKSLGNLWGNWSILFSSGNINIYTKINATFRFYSEFGLLLFFSKHLYIYIYKYV